MIYTKQMIKIKNRAFLIKSQTIVLAALFLICVAPRTASAESFIFKNSAQDTVATAKIIKEPQNKQKIFGRLKSKDDVDYFTFTLEADEAVSISIFVPAADKNFEPSLIVFGSDLPKSDHDPVIPIGEGNGSYIMEFPKTNVQEFFHDFLLTTFKTGPRLEFSSPEKSSYGLALRSPNGNTGRYLLEIGQQDEWSWSHVLDRFFDVLRAVLRLY